MAGEQPAAADSKVGKVGKSRGSGGEKEAKLVKSFPGGIRCAALVGGRQVWCADRQGTIQIRDVEGAVVKHTFSNSNLVWCMLYLPQTDNVWIGQEVGPVLVYAARTQKLLRTLTWHVGGVPCLAAASAPRLRVFSGSNDFSICVWDARTLQRVACLSAHTNGVRSLLCVGPLIWSGSDDTSIRVWEATRVVEGGGQNRGDGKGGGEGTAGPITLRGHEGSIHAMCVAGAGVWSSAADSTLREWSVVQPHECLRCVNTSEAICHLATVGDAVWAGGQLPSIAVWDTKELKRWRGVAEQAMEPRSLLKGHTGFINLVLRVQQVEIREVWSASLADKTLRVWRHRSTIDGSDGASALAAANAAYEANCADLAQREAESSVYAARLREELEAAGSRLAQHEEREAQDADELAGMRAEMAWLRAELEEARRRELATNQEVLTLRAQLEERDAALAQGQRDREQANGEQLAEVKQLREELEGAVARCSQAEEEALELRAALQRATARSEQAEARASEMELAATAAEADAEAAKQARSAALARAEKAEGAMTALEEENARLQRERDEAAQKEALMRRQFQELDVFKLDIIARELKKLDTEIDRIRDGSRGFAVAAKKMTGFSDREMSSAFASK
eukprot:gene4124-5101_t